LYSTVASETLVDNRREHTYMSSKHEFYTTNQKKETPYSRFCPILHYIPTDFEISFTGTLSTLENLQLQLKIPPPINRVTTLPCEIWSTVEYYNNPF